MSRSALILTIAVASLSLSATPAKGKKAEKTEMLYSIDEAPTPKKPAKIGTPRAALEVDEAAPNVEGIEWMMMGQDDKPTLIPIIKEEQYLKSGPKKAEPQKLPPPSTPPPISVVTPSVQNGIESNELAQTARTSKNARDETILINFNNVSVIEFIRFVSRISGKNFIFDENDLQFNVTIVSEKPTTVDNVLTALLQELRIRGFNLMERGNNLVIHRNPEVNNISRVVGVGITDDDESSKSDIITRVFSLNTASPTNVAAVIRPLTSTSALVDVLVDTNHLIVTDLSNNVEEIAKLIQSVDSPQSGLVIGQYFVQSTVIDALVPMARQVMQPIAGTNPITFVPHTAAGSVMVISTPFLVEKAMGVMQRIDNARDDSGILDMDNLRYTDQQRIMKEQQENEGGGSNWYIDENGNRIFRPRLGPGAKLNAISRPSGKWVVDKNGEWYFQPGEGSVGPSPHGRWVLDKNNNWVFVLDPDASLRPTRVQVQPGALANLPIGTVNALKFSLYKLQYRSGDQIATALRQIADSLRQTFGLSVVASNQDPNSTYPPPGGGASVASAYPHADIFATIESVNWIESSNTLIFTGTQSTIETVRDLIVEIDVPLRQVFVEMLILETTIDNSLNYGVDLAARGGGNNYATAESSIQTTSAPIIGSLDTLDNSGQLNPTNLQDLQGFNLGIIGQNIRLGGLRFGTIAAFVNAVHQRSDTNIIMNPKILCEDNVMAEIFVGINTRFQTQAVSNDEGSIITNNFEYRDVGTTLRVTPHLGNNNIVTLVIEEEVTRDLTSNTGSEGGSSSDNIQNVSPGPTTSKNSTKTRFHVPDRYFLVISGMIEDDKVRNLNQVPCLGGIPFLGGAFKNKQNQDLKRNLMIFIRPMIIDTADQVNELTRHQQNIWEYKRKTKDIQKYEVQEALEFFNVDDWNLQYKDCPNWNDRDPDFY